ncbi:hypothetical protein Cgig2_026384 [Carnegiea gigantea]|uniref:Protein FAR1-RELATED SEQUENCE n=1 Tax=Carnegiea gigantea TaxID=171969 RepID=A0A9Q1K265_9CARY|nr:hypothetical protein Cgig2_026384 [Carnegiea gigantea]
MFDLNELPNNEAMMGLFEQDMLDVSTYMIELEDMSALDCGLNNSNQMEMLDGSNGTHPQVEPNFKPFVGQTFLSEKEALVFYQNFACLHGFSVRKDRIDKKDGKIVRRDFFCHRGRTQPFKEINPTKGQRNRVSYKSNCNAHMRIKLRRFNEIFPEQWHVTTFVAEHNHSLLSPSQMCFLPVNRVISKDDEAKIFLLKDAGLTVRQIIRVLELEKNVVHGELPFLEKDIRNLFTKVRKQLARNDVVNLLDYFKSCKQEDPKFQYILKQSTKTIVTDQDPWVTEAIATELQFTKHAFCIWHITPKFSGWFTSILRNRYPDWCSEFYKLYKLETIEEFESPWDVTVAKFDPQDDKHVKGLYLIKKFWVPAYLRNYFFGGMTTTGRSEYINGFIKRFISSNTTLKDLVKQIDVAVQEIKQRNLHDDMLAIQKINVLKVKSPLENKLLREESSRSIQYLILYASGNNFILRYYEGSHNRNHQVFWDGNIIMCSCKKFEFFGILYRHILRIFLQKDSHKVPSAYLPSRWCLQQYSHELDVLEGQILIDNDPLMAGNDILCPPKSTTKGRPRKKRMKGGKGSTKHSRHCSKCKKTQALCELLPPGQGKCYCS